MILQRSVALDEERSFRLLSVCVIFALDVRAVGGPPVVGEFDVLAVLFGEPLELSESLLR